ncbi:hypothetical protein [Rufibacter tibetensis]|uniref:Uncharacterized protein n=1 Tax=Rufibacter tibetensis TaxID=512763 RepID=A0A0P0CTC1_9BACT|nr:hypothetical protein [Rufibacter tibetensis]ALJ00759.1 hypothetical protein DC20_19440 [Rufibacter tibetensis]
MKYHNHRKEKNAVFQHEDPLQNSEFDIEGLFDVLFTPPRNKSDIWAADALKEYQRIINIYKKSIALDASQEEDTDEDF